MNTFVYGLVDPRTQLIRYVGYSSTGMERPREHSQNYYLKNNTHKTAWVRQLKREGLTYSVVILEEASRETLPKRERWWIAFGRACGWPLTNATDGGEGLLNPTLETRAKMRASNVGQKRVPEVGQKIGKANSKRVWTAESRAKAARSQQGKRRTPETIAKQSASRKAWWQARKQGQE